MKTPLTILLYIAVQLLLFVLVYEAGRVAGAGQQGHHRADVAWGIALQLAVVLYSFLALVVGVCLNMATRRSVAIAVVAGAFILFTLLWMRDITYLPYRTALLLTSALAGFAGALTLKLVVLKRRGR